MNIRVIFLLISATAVYTGHCSRISSYIVGRSYPVANDYTDDFPFESDRYDRWPPPFYPTSYSRYPRELQDVELETRDVREAINEGVWSTLLNRFNIFELLRSFSSPRKSRSVKTYPKKSGKKYGRRRHRHRRINKKGKRRPRSSGIGYRPGQFATEFYDEEYSNVPEEAGLVTRIQNLLRNTLSETLSPAWAIYQRFPLAQTPLLVPFSNRADYIDPDFADSLTDETNESSDSADYHGYNESRESNDDDETLGNSNTEEKNGNSFSEDDIPTVSQKPSTDSNKDPNEANKGEISEIKGVEGEPKNAEATPIETPKS